MSLWTDVMALVLRKQGIWEIAPRLYILSAIREPEKVKAAGINVLFDLEGRIDSRVSDFLTFYAYWPIADSPTLPDIIQLQQVSWDAYHWQQIGYIVGIHCRMGRNRSALLMGEVLKLRGMEGPDAVKLIREKRPGALTNDTFREWLERE